MAEIARTGGVRESPAVPDDVRRSFVTALEVDPLWHLRMQAAFQRWTDAAVSKTVNLPASASIRDVRDTYLAAWHLGVKGITIYRYGSRARQVLTLLSDVGGEPAPPVEVDTDYSGGCVGAVCDV
jgi:ribonucleoside-diphosphate reductase alpha chain